MATKQDDRAALFLEYRRRTGETYRDVGRHFGVSTSRAWELCRHASWNEFRAEREAHEQHIRERMSRDGCYRDEDHHAKKLRYLADAGVTAEIIPLFAVNGG